MEKFLITYLTPEVRREGAVVHEIGYMTDCEDGSVLLGNIDPNNGLSNVPVYAIKQFFIYNYSYLSIEIETLDRKFLNKDMGLDIINNETGELLLSLDSSTKAMRSGDDGGIITFWLDYDYQTNNITKLRSELLNYEDSPIELKLVFKN